MEGKFPSGEDQEKIEVDSKTYSSMFEYALNHECTEVDRFNRCMISDQTTSTLNKPAPGTEGGQR